MLLLSAAAGAAWMIGAIVGTVVKAVDAGEQLCVFHTAWSEDLTCPGPMHGTPPPSSPRAAGPVPHQPWRVGTGGPLLRLQA
jgi:hypothetical protein